MADDNEAERGGERVSRPDPDPDQGNPMPDRDKSTPDPDKRTPDPGNHLPERRGNCDQEKARLLADLVAATTLATSLPRHMETVRELTGIRRMLEDLARDVLHMRVVVNTLAEQPANGRRPPNVVIINPGDQDGASIAADLINQTN